MVYAQKHPPKSIEATVWLDNLYNYCFFEIQDMTPLGAGYSTSFPHSAPNIVCLFQSSGNSEGLTDSAEISQRGYWLRSRLLPFYLDICGSDTLRGHHGSVVQWAADQCRKTGQCCGAVSLLLSACQPRQIHLQGGEDFCGPRQVLSLSLHLSCLCTSL